VMDPGDPHERLVCAESLKGRPPDWLV
jgi:hypothetical protein